MADPVNLAAGLVGFTLLAYFVGFALQLYALWLNYKQSRVKNDTQEILAVLKKIERNTK